MLILTIHHEWYVTNGFYLGGTAHWSDNHCKDYVSMLDLYESAVPGYTEQTNVDVDLETDDYENLDGYEGDDEFVNNDQFGEDAQFGEGFADDLFDDDINRYGESVNVDEFVYVDVQVEDEDEDENENENEEEPDVKDYVYRETGFEQSDEED
ncbi:hypothetical protein L3X38_013064 [Prunus dulcis]|uniref:Uncharacterized protein n=1 Tax=Prunus dulcis TaxID=3755 RepID=A0AAD4ZFT9_PRUDU|nr:hypothetical protein L3X38_013064 [Prunus dulcis]